MKKFPLRGKPAYLYEDEETFVALNAPHLSELLCSVFFSPAEKSFFGFSYIDGFYFVILALAVLQQVTDSPEPLGSYFWATAFFVGTFIVLWSITIRLLPLRFLNNTMVYVDNAPESEDHLKVVYGYKINDVGVDSTYYGMLTQLDKQSSVVQIGKELRLLKALAALRKGGWKL